MLCRALSQPPEGALGPGTLVRCDSGGATHAFLSAVAARGLSFSVGFDLTKRLRTACLAVPEGAWTSALDADGEARDGASVAELDLDVSGWPQGSRAICCRKRAHPGAQPTSSDENGHRFQVLLTNQNWDLP